MIARLDKLSSSPFLSRNRFPLVGFSILRENQVKLIFPVGTTENNGPIVRHSPPQTTLVILRFGESELSLVHELQQEPRPRVLLTLIRITASRQELLPVPVAIS